MKKSASVMTMTRIVIVIAFLSCVGLAEASFVGLSRSRSHVALRLRGGGGTPDANERWRRPSPFLIRNRWHEANKNGSNLRAAPSTTAEEEPRASGPVDFDALRAILETAEATPASDLPAALRASAERGLSEELANEYRAAFGPNRLPAAPTPSWRALIAEQFRDGLVRILVAVAIVSGLFGYLERRGASSTSSSSSWESFAEPLVIVAILILNAAVGVWQSRSATDSLAALRSMQARTCRVLRDGEWRDDADAADLVPGDVVSVRVGDRVPADCRLLKSTGSSLRVDEGGLTGESATVEKTPGAVVDDVDAPLQDKIGTLFAGTAIASGSGLAAVIRTGMDTEFGAIRAGIAAVEPEPTPLAKKLDEFGNALTGLIGIICGLVWIVSVPKMNDPSFEGNWWAGAIYYAKVAVALGVAAIPEGLPAVITLCLSLGTRRMAKRNVIVRKLPSVETLGCTSVICTDKTGTLTTNEMTAVSLVLLERTSERGHDFDDMVVERAIEGTSYSPVGRVDGIRANVEVGENPNGAVADVAAVSALCNDAKIVGADPDADEEDTLDEEGHHRHHAKKKKKPEAVERVYTRTGEPTEAALCVLAEKLGGAADDASDPLPSVLASANVNAWRTRHERRATLEFTRDRKSMSVLCDFGGDNRLLVKGAPDPLLERCTRVKFRDGTVARLSGPMRRALRAKLAELAARPLRCLALAVKEPSRLEASLRDHADADAAASHPILKDPSKYEDVESGLTLVGLVGIKDPARPEVADSIRRCGEAGIRVIMITGDARDTAIAIAKDVTIFPADGDEGSFKAFEGREFFLKSEEEQLHILKKDNIVFCRTEPADKQKLVKMLQSLGEIPAMTGDGVNDAPALRQAAIGVAMGTGTEVSKEAADMVLADDNFSTIVSAVEEGRRIYANMQAFICFLISCNIGEICAIFLATLAGFPEPLTAMHLLWVNLVTDGPPATALGFNPPAPDLMEQKPRPSDEPIMTKWLLVRYCITGLYVGLATIGIFVQHYMDQGVTLSQLANWSQCGSAWIPAGGKAAMCADLFQGSGRLLPQTLALTTLVCMEMLKALSAVSVDSSLLRVGPQSNPYLLLGVAGPFLLHLAVLYSSDLGIPALGEAFRMVPLSWDEWQNVLLWAAPILIVDEILKAIGRFLAAKKIQDDAENGSESLV